MRKSDVVYMLFGSHLYGLDTPSSDKDYKGIYLPTTDELLLGNYPKTYNHSTGSDLSKNTAEDRDEEVIALPYFVKQACAGETFALDMLHCDGPLSSSRIWESLLENRTKFYSKNMKAYVGYVKKQASKYGLKGSRLANIKNAIYRLEQLRLANVSCIGELKDKLFYGEYAQWVKYKGKGAGAVEQEFYEVNTKKYQSTNSVEYVLEQLTKMWDGYGERAKLAEKNEGVDFKAISHALRAGYQARDIYRDGDFSYPLKETDFILAVKQGQLDYQTEVAPVLEAVVEEVELLADKADLPKKVDTSYWDSWLLDIYWHHMPIQ